MMQIPTLVIGTGMGGLRVIQTLADMAIQNDDIDYYRFIAIDSSEKDLDDRIKDRSFISTVAITETDYDIEKYIPNCPYLPAGTKKKGTGAVRDRAYARFLLDINQSKVNQAITDSLRHLRDLWQKEISTGSKEVLIWIVHTLGGGTGSGSFPTLSINIWNLAQEILQDKGIKPYIYCVGILPSAANIQDISCANFDKKFLANSYAALTEINLLTDPNNLTLSRYDPLSGGVDNRSITQCPFTKYLLFGLNEDQISKMKDDEADEVEEYLKSSNKIIANMMYSIPNYQGGLENLWHSVQSPFIPFAESELIIPLEKMKKIAAENDLLGKIPEPGDEDRLTNQARMLVDLSAEEGNEKVLENSCKSLLTKDRLRGLSYFIGKLQNEFIKTENKYRTRFDDEINNTWDELALAEWAEEDIANSSHLQSPADRYNKILHLFKNRIEDNQNTINSMMPRPFLKKRLERQNKEILKTIRNLEEQVDILNRFKTLIQYINNELCNSLQPTIGHSSNGVAGVVDYIRAKENKLSELKRKITDSGWGRVYQLGVPKEYLDKLSLVEDVNVSTIKSAQSFLTTFGINQDKLTGIISNRLTQASDYALKIAIAPSNTGKIHETVSNEVFVMCNEMDESLLSQHEHLFINRNKIKISPENFSPGRFVFVSFRLGLQLEDIRDYSYRKKEYEEGKLADKIGTQEIGTIFAHPEWFPNDQNIKNVFPNLHEND